MIKKSKGFTLVELLAVIVILSIILTFTVANVVKLKKKEDIENIKNEISSTLTAAKAYCAENDCGDSVSIGDLLDSGYLTLDNNSTISSGSEVKILNCGDNSLKRYYMYKVTDNNSYDDCGCDIEQNDSTPGEKLCTNGNGTK